MRISDWSSDVCSSDLYERCLDGLALDYGLTPLIGVGSMCRREVSGPEGLIAVFDHLDRILPKGVMLHGFGVKGTALSHPKGIEHRIASIDSQARSDEHTSKLTSLMPISYAVFCLKTPRNHSHHHIH